MDFEAGLRRFCSRISARFAVLPPFAGQNGRSNTRRQFRLSSAVHIFQAGHNDHGWPKWVRLCWYGGKRLCASSQNRSDAMQSLLFWSSGVLKMEGKGKSIRKNNAPTSCMRCMGPVSQSVTRYDLEIKLLILIYFFWRRCFAEAVLETYHFYESQDNFWKKFFQDLKYISVFEKPYNYMKKSCNLLRVNLYFYS